MTKHDELQRGRLQTGTTSAHAEARLEPLARDECLRRLSARGIGRIAFLTDDGPMIVPVSYRLVDSPTGSLIAVRTRTGNVVERAPTSVAFEVDAIDPVHHEGWSVLVRGELLHLLSGSDDLRERFDPEPWIPNRDSWLVIEPWAISGRELHGAEPIWPFRPDEYL